MDDRVLLADFLDTAIMVSPDVQLHIFKHNGTGWKYWKTTHPTLKESFLSKVADEEGKEEAYFKVEVRSASTNRPVFPNTLYVLVSREGVQRWDTKPFQHQEQEQPEQDILDSDSEPTPMYGINDIIRAALEPLTQILNAQLQQTNQILSLLVRREDEDPFKELLRLRIEKEKLKLLRELSEEKAEDEGSTWSDMDGEEQALATQVIEAFRSGSLGTAFSLWTQLRERNEQLAYSLLSYAIDEIIKGNIAFPFTQQQPQQEVNNVQESDS